MSKQILTFDGYVIARAHIRTFADLEQAVSELSRLGIRKDAFVDWNTSIGEIVVELSAPNPHVAPIECGDHIPVRNADGSFVRGPYDFIVETHTHEETP